MFPSGARPVSITAAAGADHDEIPPIAKDSADLLAGGTMQRGPIRGGDVSLIVRDADPQRALLRDSGITQAPQRGVRRDFCGQTAPPQPSPIGPFFLEGGNRLHRNPRIAAEGCCLKGEYRVESLRKGVIHCATPQSEVVHGYSV